MTFALRAFPVRAFPVRTLAPGAFVPLATLGTLAGMAFAAVMFAAAMLAPAILLARAIRPLLRGAGMLGLFGCASADERGVVPLTMPVLMMATLVTPAMASALTVAAMAALAPAGTMTAVAIAATPVAATTSTLGFTGRGRLGSIGADKGMIGNDAQAVAGQALDIAQEAALIRP
ncbi:MAG TPA: hypothetical protein VFA91_03865, partial [Candidatus Polarisedimenticolia bacterium]|nr:hypothetical protein [Candidatus Polarisedimenticolia bacterium]